MTTLLLLSLVIGVLNLVALGYIVYQQKKHDKVLGKINEFLTEKFNSYKELFRDIDL